MYRLYCYRIQYNKFVLIINDSKTASQSTSGSVNGDEPTDDVSER